MASEFSNHSPWKPYSHCTCGINAGNAYCERESYKDRKLVFLSYIKQTFTKFLYANEKASKKSREN